MSLFSKILSKLGIGEAHADTPAAAPTTGASDTAAPAGSPAAPTGATPMSQVDVAAKLDGLAAQKGEQLNWKTSIVDLLKLLDLDSSLTARQELAKELNCPADKMGDSAQMNMWLHKA
ncbi:MAG TPA: oxidoreductase, partial [Pseudomonas sp.]|nr:oxidoreductase [Pseudomonas sp.]